MTTGVHLVGSVGLDSVDDVFRAAGELLGERLKRVPDGEPGGRRMWTGWQYPVLRTTSFLEPDTEAPPRPTTGLPPFKVRDATREEELRFGELGYAREARASYLDFIEARQSRVLPAHVRFQVCFPTPIAVIWNQLSGRWREPVLAAYESALRREVEIVCSRIPTADLAIQWDVCNEMIMWDARRPGVAHTPDMEPRFRAMFGRLAQMVPPEAELGFHLCYGDFDGRHFIEPVDTAKMVELANLISSSAGRRVDWIHMPVPISRDDAAFYRPLRGLDLQESAELYLGLVHWQDGVPGTKRRIATAREHAPVFGIACECGMARARSPAIVRELLRIHAEAAA